MALYGKVSDLNHSWLYLMTTPGRSLRLVVFNVCQVFSDLLLKWSKKDGFGRKSNSNNPILEVFFLVLGFEQGFAQEWLGLTEEIKQYF